MLATRLTASSAWWPKILSQDHFAELGLAELPSLDFSPWQPVAARVTAIRTGAIALSVGEFTALVFTIGALQVSGFQIDFQVLPEVTVIA